jgi:hypothetical protein
MGKRVEFCLRLGSNNLSSQSRVRRLKKQALRRLSSPAEGKIQAMKHKETGDTFKVDVALETADPEDYHALVLRVQWRN